jgi:hypothetical protein
MRRLPLYRVRNQKAEQPTRDHTLVGGRMRMGLISADRARNHPDRSALSRSIGQELIPSIDRITTPLLQHDRLIMCSDGGMASIFKAVDRLNGHTVAIKIPYAHFESDVVFYGRFRRQEEVLRPRYACAFRRGLFG